MREHDSSANLRYAAVFLLGISVGVCLMLLYTSWKTPHHEVTIEIRPWAEMESLDE